MTALEQIRESTLFKNLPERYAEEIADSATQKSYKRNEIIVAPGQAPHFLYLIQEGRVLQYIRSIDNQISTVGLFSAGDFFNHPTLFDPNYQSPETKALLTTEIVEIPSETVKNICTKDTTLAWEICNHLAADLQEAKQRISDSTFLDVTGRTAKQILVLSDGNNEFSLPITQEELAGFVGASRERVNKALATFVKLGWLEQRDRQYTIVNKKQLEVRSEFIAA